MINIEKKHLFLIIAVTVFLTGAIIAVATAPDPGHDISQIGMPACTNGQTIVKSDSGWVCGSSSTTPSLPTLECASYHIQGNSIYAYGGSRIGGNYEYGAITTSNVVELVNYGGAGGYEGLRCKEENGWILTGCSGVNNYEITIPNNGGNGEKITRPTNPAMSRNTTGHTTNHCYRYYDESWGQVTFVRCCRIV